jgi:hypothetical protein
MCSWLNHLAGCALACSGHTSHISHVGDAQQGKHNYGTRPKIKAKKACRPVHVCCQNLCMFLLVVKTKVHLTGAPSCHDPLNVVHARNSYKTYASAVLPRAPCTCVTPRPVRRVSGCVRASLSSCGLKALNLESFSCLSWCALCYTTWGLHLAKYFSTLCPQPTSPAMPICWGGHLASLHHARSRPARHHHSSIIPGPGSWRKQLAVHHPSPLGRPATLPASSAAAGRGGDCDGNSACPTSKQRRCCSTECCAHRELAPSPRMLSCVMFASTTAGMMAAVNTRERTRTVQPARFVTLPSLFALRPNLVTFAPRVLFLPALLCAVRNYLGAPPRQAAQPHSPRATSCCTSLLLGDLCKSPEVMTSVRGKGKRGRAEGPCAV